MSDHVIARLHQLISSFSAIHSDLAPCFIKRRNYINCFLWEIAGRTSWIRTKIYIVGANPSGHAVKGVGLRPLACWDCRFESRQGHGYLSLMSVVCCQAEVSASGWSLVQRSPTKRGVSECDREATIMTWLWPTMGCCAMIYHRRKTN